MTQITESKCERRELSQSSGTKEMDSDLVDKKSIKDSKDPLPGQESTSDGSIVEIEFNGTLRDDSYGQDAGFLATIKVWRYAVAWSTAFCFPMILVAYSPAWVTAMYALPAFAMEYGSEYEGVYLIEAKWQTALSTASIAGMIAGAPVIAVLMEKYGRKTCFIVTLVLQGAFVFLEVFGNSIALILVGALLLGFCIGCFSVLSLTYAVDIAPFRLRGFLGGLYSVGIMIGQVLAMGVSQGTSTMEGHWAYDIGFAVQWAWPVILLPIMIFAPESPVWLIRQGRVAEAEATMRRLTVKDFDVSQTIALIEDSNRMEQQIAKTTTYSECFRGSNRRRTIIAMVTYSTVITTGITLAGYVALFLQLAGVAAETAFKMSVGSSSASLLGAFVALVILAKFRRRKLYVASQFACAALLFGIGFLQLPPTYYRGAGLPWGQAILMTAYQFIFGAAISPLSSVIMGEVASSRLRSRTIAIASATQGISTVVVTVIFPYYINPDGAHLQGYIGFIQGGVSLVFSLWILFYVPETNMPEAQLNILFEKKVKARKFTMHDFLEQSMP